MSKPCPICKKILLTTTAGGLNYFCQTRIFFPGKASIAHYRQDSNEGPVWYAPPYKIQITDNGSKISEFINEELPMGRFAQPEFKFIFEAKATFHPDDPDKIARRIKSLILFS